MRAMKKVVLTLMLCLLVSLWACSSTSPAWKSNNLLSTTERLHLNGRLLEVEDDPFIPTRFGPFDDIFEERIGEAPLQVLYKGVHGVEKIAELSTDKEGSVDRQVSLTRLGLEPGPHDFIVLYDGEKVGEFTTQLLAPESAPLVLRSDVFWTYLMNNPLPKDDLIHYVLCDNLEHESHPGMKSIYAQLAQEGVLLTFISGHGDIFGSSLLDKLANLDGLETQGIALKAVSREEIRAFMDRESGRLILSERDKIAFKLAALLELRLDLPDGAAEILIGDDAEIDIIVYSLYARLLKGDLSLEELESRLLGYELSEMERLKINGLAKRVVERRPAPVQGGVYPSHSKPQRSN